MYNKVIRRKLKDRLIKLDNRQLKLFYGMLVHYWVKYKFFISSQNFLNLWCELNKLCYEVDESFPDPYDDHKSLKSFCQSHPYYFIDILDPGLITDLFCEYLDDRLNILVAILDKFSMGDLWASYEYSNKVLGLSEDVDELVKESLEHLKTYS
jgi:hypothetical protein